ITIARAAVAATPGAGVEAAAGAGVEAAPRASVGARGRTVGARPAATAAPVPPSRCTPRDQEPGKNASRPTCHRCPSRTRALRLAPYAPDVAPVQAAPIRWACESPLRRDRRDNVR